MHVLDADQRRRATAAARPAPGTASSPRAPGCSARTRAAAGRCRSPAASTRSPGAVNSTCSIRSRMCARRRRPRRCGRGRRTRYGKWRFIASSSAPDHARLRRPPAASGVPVGAQIAWLSISTTGWPSTNTRVAATTHCAGDARHRCRRRRARSAAGDRVRRGHRRRSAGR